MTTTRGLLAGATGAALLLAVAVAAQAQDGGMPEEINFGIISTESQQNLKQTWEPFLADMEEDLGVGVNAFFAPDYAGIIEAMRFGKVDVAWFGNKSAMEAVDRADGEIFAQTVDVEGNPGYWSLLVVPADSPLQSLDDVLTCDRSLDFGIGDPNSTSGYLVPTTFIFAANGITPEECFKTVRSANHETNLMAAANRQVDVATNNTENLRRLEMTNPEAVKKVRVIWRSPLIPSDPLVWRSDLSAEAKEAIYHFIMTYGRNGTEEEIKAERAVLEPLGWAPFQPSSNAQLYPIREMELTKEKMQVQTDSALDEAARQDKVAELDQQIVEVKRMTQETPRM